MLSEISDILIIVNKDDINLYKKLLGNGSRFEIKLTYKIQEKPSGIPEAFNIGKDFIKNSNVA